MKVLALTAVVAALATSAAAHVFTASAPVDFSLIDFRTVVGLPEYPGPGEITDAVFTLSGHTYAEQDITADVYDLPPQDVSWTLRLSVLDPHAGAELGAWTVFSQLPAAFSDGTGKLPGFRRTPIEPFTASAEDFAFDLYAGSGVRDFQIELDSTGLDFTEFFGTLSERLSIGVPEPSAWALSIAGFLTTGAALRRGRARRSSTAA